MQGKIPALVLTFLGSVLTFFFLVTPSVPLRVMFLIATLVAFGIAYFLTLKTQRLQSEKYRLREGGDKQ